MLKEFAQYLVSLKDNKTYEIDGQTYSDRELCRVAPYVPRPRRITVNGLASIPVLVSSELAKIPDEAMPIFVRIGCSREVDVFTGLDKDMERDSLYFCQCDAPEFKAGWMDYDTAIIRLRSMFIPNEGTEYLLDLLSRISKENGVTTLDNGVTQQVEARSGISLKTKEAIRPRVKLRPFRTFSEVEQPESEFLVRVDGEGNIGFFEADGGAWELTAKKNIMEYLLKEPSPLFSLVALGKVVVMA